MVSKESFKRAMPFYGNRANDLYSRGREYPRIENGNIDDLLARLREMNVDINPDDSVMTVNYNERNFTVPFGCQFPNNEDVSVKRYIFNGDNITIKLRNYDNTHPVNPGAYGSPSTGEIGIACSITIEDSYQGDRDDIRKIREVIEEFYSPFRELVEQVKRETKPRGKKTRSMRKR